MEQTEGRMDFRSARSELEEKEKAEVGKVEFWEKTKNLKPTFDFWPLCQPIESQRVWQRVTHKPRKIFRNTRGRARKPRKS